MSEKDLIQDDNLMTEETETENTAPAPEADEIAPEAEMDEFDSEMEEPAPEAEEIAPEAEMDDFEPETEEPAPETEEIAPEAEMDDFEPETEEPVPETEEIAPETEMNDFEPEAEEPAPETDEIAPEAEMDEFEPETEEPAPETPQRRVSTPIDLVERMDSALWRAPLRRAKASKKSRAKKVLLTLLLIACLCVFAYAAYQLALIIREYVVARNLYQQIASSYTVSADKNVGSDAETEGEISEEATVDGLPDWYQMLSVDFEALQGFNADAVGWLYLEGSDIINYPVLYSGNNTAYLRTSIDGKYALAGSIFLEGSNAPTFEDAHSLIYGHQMRDGSMFGTLQKFKEDENFYADHMYFQIRTPEKAYRYQIFSYHDVSATDEVYTIFNETGTDEYDAWIENVEAASYRQTGITVTNMDRIVTLSTCSDDNDRFVVHGVLVGTVDTAEMW